ncbi:MAG: hypothetical protein ACFFDB_12965 [Promethearchaeota archaeon]
MKEDILSSIRKLLKKQNKEGSIGESTHPRCKIGWLYFGRKKASIGCFKKNKVAIFREYTSGLRGKDGISEIRYKRLIAETKNVFCQRILKFLNERFLRYEELQRIFVGSQWSIKEIEERIQKSDILDTSLKEKLKFIDISDREKVDGLHKFLEIIKIRYVGENNF